MIKNILITILGLLFIIACNSNSDSVPAYDIKQLRTDIINNVEKPTTDNFVKSIDDLNMAINNFMSTTNEANLESVKKAWKLAAQNYSLIQVLNIGDIKTSYIQTSFFSWVANENAIEDYISSTKEISEQAINSISTNSRGLSAIELLIFKNTNTETLQSFSNTRRKNYLKVLGLNLVSKATIYNTKWASFRTKFIENQTTGISGGINQVVNQMYALLEDVKSYKIGQPAGIEKTVSPDASILQATKSSYSLELIKKNIENVKNIYFGKDNGIDDYVSFIAKNEELNNKIKNQIQTLELSISSLNTTYLKDAIFNKKPEVKKLYDEVRNLLILIKTDVASTLSVTITFTDNDGD
ncbi:imelysin family protein [uncultured Tenacibaculum sp.]|uniref:imelysin family protein n=1 Tax=uncultured Tenacibaculum sp. TaxID=174713 RepID=UPI0026100518|nr:imelysin family protein [uncultured Tenacibaculum sp.]